MFLKRVRNRKFLHNNITHFPKEGKFIVWPSCLDVCENAPMWLFSSFVEQWIAGQSTESAVEGTLAQKTASCLSPYVF